MVPSRLAYLVVMVLVSASLARALSEPGLRDIEPDSATPSRAMEDKIAKLEEQIAALTAALKAKHVEHKHEQLTAGDEVVELVSAEGSE